VGRGLGIVLLIFNVCEGQEVHFPNGLKIQHFADSIMVPLSGVNHGYELVDARKRWHSRFVEVHYSPKEGVAICLKADASSQIIELKYFNMVTVRSRWLHRQWWYEGWLEKYPERFPSSRENEK